MSYKDGHIYCNEPGKIPKEPHYAIIEFDTYWVAGYDERDSGYSASKANYIAFDNKENWEAEIRRRSLDRTSTGNKWVALHVNPAKIELTASISVSMQH